MKFKITLIILGMFFVKGFAQEQGTKGNSQSEKIFGIWQLIVNVADKQAENKIKVIPVPLMKIYNPDGTYFIARMTKENICLVNSHGNFEITQEGKMTEFIKSSVIDPHLTGTKSELEYKLERGGDLLISNFKLENSNQWRSETWVRVVRY